MEGTGAMRRDVVLVVERDERPEAVGVGVSIAVDGHPSHSGTDDGDGVEKA